MIKMFLLIIMILCTTAGFSREADNGSRSEPPSFLYRFDQNLYNSFWGCNALLMSGVVGSSYLLVHTDVDASVNDYAADMDTTFSTVFGVPGLLVGAVGPVLLPLSIYCFADEGDYETIAASYTVAQAVVLSFGLNNMLKAVTGRVPPDRENRSHTGERSRRFRFGFLRGGVFDGWPSGHSMVNMAVATSLAHYYPEKTGLNIALYGGALYIMACVVFGMNGDVHWLSDAVAGGMMGYAVGATVGNSFYQYRVSLNRPTENNGGRTAQEYNIQILPVVAVKGGAVLVSCTF